MKSYQSILAILCLSFFYTTHYGQTKPTEEIPYIEVNGYAEKEVIPNEIYIGITLRERMGIMTTLDTAYLPTMLEP